MGVKCAPIEPRRCGRGPGRVVTLRGPHLCAALSGCACLVVLAACDALLGHEPDRPEGGDAAAVVPDATPADLDAASPGLDASAIVDASSPGDASAVDATAIDASVAEADAAAFVPDIGPVDAGCPAHSYPCTSGCCTKLLAAGGDHGCASNAQGEVFCWGAWGSAEKSSGPTKILGVSNAAALAAGGAFSCAIDQGKNLSCWGFNQWGELGIGNWTMDPVWTATRVATAIMYRRPWTIGWDVSSRTGCPRMIASA